MRILKAIVGILAVLFVLTHFVEVIEKLMHGAASLSSAYSIGHMSGNVIGICVGVVIAVACFRKKKAGTVSGP